MFHDVANQNVSGNVAFSLFLQGVCQISSSATRASASMQQDNVISQLIAMTSQTKRIVMVRKEAYRQATVCFPILVLFLSVPSLSLTHS